MTEPRHPDDNIIVTMERRALKIILREHENGVPYPFVVEQADHMTMWHHVRELCEISTRDGVPCCIHSPSDHHMREWPMHFRYDRGIMERTCEHGTGHPDPDDAAYRLWFYNTYGKGEYDTGVHGCDLCCGHTNSQALAAAKANLAKVEEIRVPTYNEDDGTCETISTDDALAELRAILRGHEAGPRG